MLEDADEIRALIGTIKGLLEADGNQRALEVLRSAKITCEQTHYDNWNGGTYHYALYLTVDVDVFVKHRDVIEAVETEILGRIELASKRHQEANEYITKVIVIPKAIPRIDWQKLNGITTKTSLIDSVNYLRDTMIAVSTGGPRIQDIDAEYRQKYQQVDQWLKLIDIENPNPYKGLWDWYGKWSSGDLPQYRDRRAFIGEMYAPLLDILNETVEPDLIGLRVDLSEWERLERSVKEIKVREKEAASEEQCQAVGLLCRDTIITLAQAVYNPDKHPSPDGVKPSPTDAKRMLEGYISAELSGGENETLRKYAKSTLDLANTLTHKRTATKRDASLCATAALSVINLIGILEGRF